MVKPRGLRIGTYEVQTLIGVGGMGEVYRARDTRLERDVAIKFLPEEFAANADRRARFEREARSLASINHPNIAAIYGVEEPGDDAPALVLELVEGPTLAERLLRGPLAVAEALSIAAQIAAALAAAHEVGIVHRDLKPQNVKLKADGTVKVLDFGLAKTVTSALAAAAGSSPPTATSGDLTNAGTVLGTPAYMSPEQTRGREVDKRADVWAFGCVLYEMLTGRRAFAGDDVPETIAAVLRSEPAWSELPPEVPASVLMLLRRCLEKDVAQRLRDLGDVRFLLEDSSPRREVPPLREVDRGADAARPRWPWAVAASVGVIALVVALALQWGSLSDGEVPATPTASPAASGEPGVARSRERLPDSIAVLPFENLSSTSDDASFASGLHEEIVNQLSKLRSLNVISRNSVLRYAENRPSIGEIAAELGVGTVMEGSVRYAGSELRVNAALIDPDTEAVLWSDSFRADGRNVGEVFAIHTDIATNIANALGAEITAEDRGRIDRMPTESAAAYAHYVRAKDYAMRAEFGAVVRELNAAIEQDPRFAEAYAQRAYYYAYAQITSWGRTQFLRDNPSLRTADFQTLALNDAQRALDLYDRAGMAWLARAITHLFHLRYRQAGDAFARALEVSPNDPAILGEYGMFWSYIGDIEGARQLIQRAERYDPNGAITLYYVGTINLAAGRPEEAAAAFEKGLRLNPADVNHNLMGALSAPDWRAAERRLSTLERLVAETGVGWALPGMSVAYRRVDRAQEADDALTRYAEWASGEAVGAAEWAQYHLMRGDLDSAFVALETAVETLESGRADAGFFALQRLLETRATDATLNEPRFRALFERLEALTAR